MALHILQVIAAMVFIAAQPHAVQTRLNVQKVQFQALVVFAPATLILLVIVVELLYKADLSGQATPHVPKLAQQ